MKNNPLHEPGQQAPAFLLDYDISFISDMNASVEHYHPCLKLIVSLDGQFGCNIDGQAPVGLRGIVVNQNITHSLFPPDTHFLVSLIKTDSFYGAQLNAWLAGRAWVDIVSVLPDEHFGQVLPPNYEELPNEILIPHVKTFLDSIFPQSRSTKTPVTDERILVALDFIEQNIHETLELEDVAGQINLSPERMRHLFVEQMHISFSQYILWSRITKTMSVAITEESRLAQACLRFGFADQPHFNKSFKKIFGLSPAGLIRESRVLL